MGVADAQILALVRREIDDQQPPARHQQPRRLGDRRRRLSAHNGAPGGGSTVSAAPDGRAAAQYMSPWRSSAEVEPGLGELDPGEPEHFGAAVDAERMRGARRRTIRSCGRCRCRYRPAARPGARRQARGDRRLDLALGDMERADRVPLAGMAREIALGRGGAVGADRGEPRGIGGGPGIVAVNLGPALEQLEQSGVGARPRRRG